jgi:ankyrin repeat protein
LSKALYAERDRCTEVAYVIGRVHVEAVRISLEREDLNDKPGDRLTGMMRAALIGHTDAVSAFLDRGIDANSRDTSGHTPLMEAVFGGHIDTVEALLKRGADVNSQDNDGWTALMEAAAKGRADVVRTLLAHGADPRVKNKKGWTALHTTAKCNTEVSRLLRNAGGD